MRAALASTFAASNELKLKGHILDLFLGDYLAQAGHDSPLGPGDYVRSYVMGIAIT